MLPFELPLVVMFALLEKVAFVFAGFDLYAIPIHIPYIDLFDPFWW